MQAPLLYPVSQHAGRTSFWNCPGAKISCGNWQSTPVLQHAHSWERSAGEILAYFLKGLAFWHFNPISLLFGIYFPRLYSYFQTNSRRYHAPIQLSFPKIVFFCKLWIFVTRKREISLWLAGSNAEHQRPRGRGLGRSLIPDCWLN